MADAAPIASRTRSATKAYETKPQELTWEEQCASVAKEKADILKFRELVMQARGNDDRIGMLAKALADLHAINPGMAMAFWMDPIPRHVLG